MANQAYVFGHGTTGVYKLLVDQGAIGPDGETIYSEVVDIIDGTLVLGAGTAAIGKLAANSGVDIGDVDVASIAAGETHLGSIGGNTVFPTQTPTITAGAYSAKDAVGGLLTFANAARVSGGTIRIESVVVTDLSIQAADLVLALFDRTFTATADNDAFDPSDADLANCLGYIRINNSDYATFADNCVATLKGVGLSVKLNGTSLFGQLMCTGTPTYASTGDLVVKLGILQD